MPLDSPLLQAIRGGGGRDGRSPGLATLKEAFDITYAVHRMEEEGAYRRAYKGPGGAGARGFLHGLNESDEDVDGVAELRAKHGAEAGRVLEAEQTRARASEYHQGQQSQQHTNRGTDRHMAQRTVYDGCAGTRDQPLQKRVTGAGFDLDLDGATLLGRRHRRAAADSSPLRQPTSTDGTRPAENAPSPMRDIEE